MPAKAERNDSRQYSLFTTMDFKVVEASRPTLGDLFTKNITFGESLFNILSRDKFWQGRKPGEIQISDEFQRHVYVIDPDSEVVTAENFFGIDPIIFPRERKQPEYSVIVVVWPHMTDANQLEPLHIFLRDIKKRVKDQGIVYVCEAHELGKKQLVSKRTDLIKKSGFHSLQFIDENGFLIWRMKRDDALDKRTFSKHSHTKIGQTQELPKYPDWINRMFKDVRLYYQKLGLTITDDTELRKIIDEGNSYKILELLKNRGGVEVASSCGCSFHIPTNGRDPEPSFRCEDHRDSGDIPVFDREPHLKNVQKTRNSFGIFSEIHTLDLDCEAQQIDFKCPGEFCGNNLEMRTRIMKRIKREGKTLTKVLVEVSCPNDGLIQTYVVLVGGSDIHQQVVMEVNPPRR